jgi:hypothetical protein
MDSELFRKWQFSGGEWHNGPRKGNPIPVSDAAIGKIVILTTRKPNESESERKIIGLYEIGEIDKEGYLRAHEDFRIRLRVSESKQLSFWRYYRNDKGGTPFWGSLLFRYLNDSQVHRILADTAAAVGDSHSKEIAQSLILRKFKNSSPPVAVGALVRQEPIERSMALARKYPGGEGPAHLALKNWIAKHPSFIGLPRQSLPSIEHIFKSGDCVDIAFKSPDGTWTAVEIETIDPFPGAHQVIKYRALLAAQQGWALNTPRVRGILVAWDYSVVDLDFCRKYEIEPWKCRSGQSGTLQR